MHHDSDTTNTHSTASSDANDVNNLLLRLYNTVLTNSLVQTGMKQLSGLTQPIIGKYEDLVAVKSNVSNWVTNGNVYNFLVNQWLADNLPYNGTVATYDVFVKGLDRLLRNGSRHQHEFDSRTFYEFASQVWLTQSHPDLEDIKNSMLVVVARVVNKKYRFEEEALAQGLYNMLRMLIEKRRELVSAESFFNLVKMSLEGDYFERYTQIVKSACDEYYSFARRFLLVDFPLVATNKNFIKVTIKFLQDNLLIHGDSTLNFIERQLDYLLNLFGQKANGSLEDHSIIEKSQRILKKAYVLSVFPFKKIENQMYHLCDNRVVNTMDKYIHFSDRIDEAIGLTAWGYRTLKENILDPTVGAVRLVKDKTTSQLVVVLHGLDPRVIRKRWNKLRNQYDILKQCAVIVEQGVVKIIMDKKTREELSEEAKKELMRFYQEVKTLERQKIADVTMGYYVQILKKAKKTYKTAKKNVQYQQVQAASQVKQVVHAKEEQQVEMPDSESSASEEELKSTAVEATA